MQGQGTRQNPYIVKTWEDFYSMQADGATYYALANDLDFKDYDRHLSRFPLGFLDGAGHTLDNIVLTTVFTAADLSDDSIAAVFIANSCTSVSNLTIRATSLASPLMLCVEEDSETPAKFDNCNFGTIMTNLITPFCANRTKKSQGIIFYECSISMMASTRITLSPATATCIFIRCHIAVNSNDTQTGLVTDGTNTFLMCRLEGRIGGKAIGNMAVVNCVIALDAPNVIYHFIKFSNENTNPDLIEIDCAMTIADKTLFPLIAESTEEYEHAAFLTTAEMKDIEMLKAAGFTNVEEV